MPQDCIKLVKKIGSKIWDILNSDVARYRISGKTEDDRIPNIRPILITGYLAEYQVAKISDIRPRNLINIV